MNNKELRRSSFKSFFRNKIGAILLAVIVFLSATTFTVLDSSISNYNTSYKQVIKDGNLHEYTLKERYAITGNVAYEKVIDPTSKETIVGVDEKILSGSVNGGEFIAFQTGNEVSNWVSSSFFGGLLYNYPVAIDIKSIKLTGTPGSFTGISYLPSNKNRITMIMGRSDVYGKTRLEELMENKTYPTYIEAIFNDRKLNHIKLDYDPVDKKFYYFNTDKEYQLRGGYANEGVTFDKVDFDKFILKTINDTETKYPKTIINKEIGDVTVKPRLTSTDPKHPEPITTEDFLNQYNAHQKEYERVFKGVYLKNINSTPQITDAIDELIKKMRLRIKQEKSDLFLTSPTGIINEVKKQTGLDLLIKRTNSVNILATNGARKIVDSSDNSSAINKLIIFDGNKLPVSQPKTIDDLKKIYNQIKADWLAENPNSPDNPFLDDSLKIDVSKGWISTLEYTYKDVPRVYGVVDPTSFLAVVSPSFAKENNIKPLPKEVFTKQQTSNSKSNVNDRYNEFVAAVKDPNDSTGIDRMMEKYPNSYVKIGAVPYFITGVGVQPDFSYPIISSMQPVADPNSQAILFANKSGYQRGLSSFASAEQENYVAFSFNGNPTEAKKAEAVSLIEKMAKDNMDWPNNIRITSKYNDTSEKIILAPQRISFLEKLNKTISSVAYTVIIGLLLLTTLIVVTVVKRIISSERKTLAILHANGYSKIGIASSYILPGFLISVISSIIGYLVGLFLQPVFVSIFSSFWTIPTKTIGFSLYSLLPIVLFPLMAVGVFIILVGLYELRGSSLSNMVDKHNKLALMIAHFSLRSVRWAGIKTKLTVSFIVTNLGKMAMILFSAIISISVIGVGLTSSGKFNYAISETAKVNKYEFAVDLVSPSQEGGQYIASIPNDPNLPKYANKWTNKPTRHWLGMEKVAGNPAIHGLQYIGKNDDYSISAPFDPVAPQYDYSKMTSYMHIPGRRDGIAYKSGEEGWARLLPQNDDLYNQVVHYLKGKVQSKAFLSALMGRGENLGDMEDQAIPWDVNKHLMPSNQQLSALEDYMPYLIKLRESEANKNFRIDPSWVENLDADNIPGWDWSSSDPERHTIKDSWLPTLDEMIAQYKSGNIIPPSLMKEFASKITAESKGMENAEVAIMRSSFIRFIENGIIDGIYPFVLAYNQITMNTEDEVYTSIRGDSLFSTVDGKRQLTPLSIKGINHDSEYIDISKTNINNLVKYKGNKIPVLVNKYMDEYYGLHIGTSFKNKVENMSDRFVNPTKNTSTTFEVVGIIPSYSSNEIITLREIANKVLGLDVVQGFNGVFTHEKKPMVLKNVNLYSHSGLYPAFNSFPNDASNEYYQAIENYLHSSYSTLPEKDMNSFIKTYSTKVYSSTINNVEWVKMNDFTFKSINNLSSSLIVFVESIAAIIAIIFIVILGSIMIQNNKRNISVMKVMGYRDVEIRNTFIKSFIPSLILASLISIPIIFSILLLIKTAIMSFGAVLIPLTMTGWEIPVAVVLVFTLFITIFVASIKQLKSTSALEVFKE